MQKRIQKITVNLVGYLLCQEEANEFHEGFNNTLHFPDKMILNFSIHLVAESRPGLYLHSAARTKNYARVL